MWIRLPHRSAIALGGGPHSLVALGHDLASMGLTAEARARQRLGLPDLR